MKGSEDTKLMKRLVKYVDIFNLLLEFSGKNFTWNISTVL